MADPNISVPLLMTGYNPPSVPGFQGPIHTLLHGDRLILPGIPLGQGLFLFLIFNCGEIDTA